MKKEVIIATICLALFIIILAGIPLLSPMDNSFNSYVQTIQTPALVKISEIIGQIFEPINIIVLSLLLALILFLKGFRKDSFLFVGIMFAGGVLEYLLKFIIERARPENALIPETLNSFPSGHALISLIFAGFFIYLILKNIKSKTYKTILSLVMITFALFVGASRLILNVHWFSDIIGAWLLGLSILYLGIFYKKIVTKK